MSARIASQPLPVKVYTKGLTDRQIEVLARVVDGALNKEIARDLGISIKTVEAHMAHLLVTFNARNRMALVIAVNSLRIPPTAAELTADLLKALKTARSVAFGATADELKQIDAAILKAEGILA